MNTSAIPDGLCIEDIKIWSNKNPEHIGRLRKKDSFEILVNLTHINALKYGGARRSIEYFNQIKSELEGEEKEREAVACALLNLVGSALLYADAREFVVTNLSFDEEGCYLHADSYTK